MIWTPPDCCLDVQPQFAKILIPSHFYFLDSELKAGKPMMCVKQKYGDILGYTDIP